MTEELLSVGEKQLSHFYGTKFYRIKIIVESGVDEKSQNESGKRGVEMENENKNTFSVDKLKILGYNTYKIEIINVNYVYKFGGGYETSTNYGRRIATV